MTLTSMIKECFGHIKYTLKYEIAYWLDGMGVLTKWEFHGQECIYISSGIRSTMGSSNVPNKIK